jgi:hypothetical protein
MTPELPRRHAQYQALLQRNEASVGNLRSQEQRQRHKLKNTRNKRVGCGGDSDSSSESDSDIDVDTDREEKEDSGYGSNTDDEAEYLNELVEQFKEMGPKISNLGDVAQEMIQREQRMF